ncbi:MAG: hypothetical protein AAF436_02230 [Myxococcota bacterium]
MFALDVLEQGKGLAEGTERVLDACFAVWLRRCELRFEECADRPCHILSHLEHFVGDVCLLLERFERLSERFASAFGLVRA